MGKVSMKKKTEEKKADGAIISAKTERFDKETMFYFRKELDVDIIVEFEKLKDVGQLPADKLMDRIALSNAINCAASNSRQANKIYLKAKTEREFYRIEFDRELQDLHRDATTNVATWLEENDVKKKQITKDMVQQEISSDKKLRAKYEALILKQEELRSICQNCEVLAREWVERKWTLRAQAALVAAEKETKLPELEKGG